MQKFRKKELANNHGGTKCASRATNLPRPFFDDRGHGRAYVIIFLSIVIIIDLILNFVKVIITAIIVTILVTTIFLVLALVAPMA